MAAQNAIGERHYFSAGETTFARDPWGAQGVRAAALKVHIHKGHWGHF